MYTAEKTRRYTYVLSQYWNKVICFFLEYLFKCMNTFYLSYNGEDVFFFFSDMSLSTADVSINDILADICK